MGAAAQPPSARPLLRPCAFTDEIALDFEDAIQTCVEAGLFDIQVRGVGGANVVLLDDRAIARLVALARRFGVRVVGIGSPFGKCDPAEDAYRQHLPVFERSIEVAHAFGAPMLRVFAFHRPATGTAYFDALFPRIVERLGPIADRARQEGLVLGLENEYTTLAGTAQHVRRVIDAVGSPALRACWDVASGWHDGEAILPDGYDHMRGFLCDVHVRDAHRDPADPRWHGALARPGDGAIPYAEICRRLAQDGYEGTLTLETHLYAGAPDRWERLKAATLYGLDNVRAWIDGAAACPPADARVVPLC